VLEFATILFIEHYQMPAESHVIYTCIKFLVFLNSPFQTM